MSKKRCKISKKTVSITIANNYGNMEMVIRNDRNRINNIQDIKNANLHYPKEYSFKLPIYFYFYFNYSYTPQCTQRHLNVHTTSRRYGSSIDVVVENVVCVQGNI